MEINQLEGQFQSDQTQRLLQSASHILSDLTRFAGVVMTPRRRSIVLRHVEFLRLSDKRILLILVTPDGDVQNRILLTDRTYSPSELIEAANFINQNFAGLTFEEVKRRLHDELKQLARRHDPACSPRRSRRAMRRSTEPPEEYVLSGEHNLLHVQDLSSNVSSLRRLFDLFEQRTSLLQLLEMGSRAQGVQIYIGGESGPGAPGRVQRGHRAATRWTARCSARSGVIGPTRMAYERVIPIVEITAKLLSMAMSQRVRALE